MNEIIKINYDSEQPTVSARDLYDEIGSTERFSAWFERQLQYGFEEDVDYSNPKKVLRVQKEGNRDVQREVEDYDLTVSMAKEICMIQKNERARSVRKYLIQLEEAWNTPEQVFARALKMAEKTIDSLKDKNAILIEENEKMKPKAEFFDAVTDSKDAIDMGEVAKVLNYPGIGRNKLFEILRDNNILRENNEPYQKYIDNGCFRVIEQKYEVRPGEIRINIKTLVFQKGVDFIRKLLDKLE